MPANIVVPLPQGISLRDAALVEPVAVAHHDVERGRLVAGERVVVVGGGPVGVLVAVVAAARGAQVLVIEPDAYRRGVIEGLGFAVVDPADDVAAAVAAHTQAPAPTWHSRSRARSPGSPPPWRCCGRAVAWWLLASTRNRASWTSRASSGESSRSWARGFTPVPTSTQPSRWSRRRRSSRPSPDHQRDPHRERARRVPTLEGGGTVMKVLVDCRGSEA